MSNKSACVKASMETPTKSPIWMLVSMPTQERSTRKNDAGKTKEDILTVATEEFAAHGLSGGRLTQSLNAHGRPSE